MGRVESERASIHYSSNPVRPCLESRVRHSIYVAQFLCMSVVMFPILELLCLKYFAVVGDPPYRGFKGCLPIHANRDYLLGLWLVVIVWDTRKYMQTCHVFFPLTERQWCWYSYWYLVSKHVSNSGFWVLIIHFTLIISVRSSGNSALTKVVYRDGKTLFSWWRTRQCWTTGVIYYLFLFGGSCAVNEWNSTDDTH